MPFEEPMDLGRDRRVGGGEAEGGEGPVLAPERRQALGEDRIRVLPDRGEDELLLDADVAEQPSAERLECGSVEATVDDGAREEVAHLRVVEEEPLAE
ncbi:MAG: hypothetical protein R3B09_31795 [Nannocystaceae bacterium]